MNFDYTYLFVTAISVGIIASYYDFKDKTIPDSLHIILIVSALTYRIYLSLIYSNPQIFIAPLILIILFSGMALILYYRNSLGGADVKHLMAYSLVLPYFFILEMFYITLYFIVTFIIVGLMYIGIMKIVFPYERYPPFMPVFPLSLSILVSIKQFIPNIY